MIIGPGALGLFLAWDQATRGCSAQVVLLGKRKVGFPVSIKSPGEHSGTISSSQCLFYQEAKSINWKTIERIFVTVQPDQILAVASIIANSPVNNNTLIIFACNGIVSDEAINILVKNHPQINIARALIYAGVTRTILERETVIEHLGGNRATWGWLRKSQNSGAHKITGKILTWEYSENIVSVEAEKLFTNLVLSEVIGSSKIPNGELFNLISVEKTELAAKRFCDIFDNRNINPRTLIASLKQTIDETAKNINSSTTALLKSNTAPRDAFRAALETQAKSTVEATELYQILRT